MILLSRSGNDWGDSWQGRLGSARTRRLGQSTSTSSVSAPAAVYALGIPACTGTDRRAAVPYVPQIPTITRPVSLRCCAAHKEPVAARSHDRFPPRSVPNTLHAASGRWTPPCMSFVSDLAPYPRRPHRTHQVLQCWNTAGRSGHIKSRGLDARLARDGARRSVSSPISRVLLLASALTSAYLGER
jgi:hypothetical protein